MISIAISIIILIGCLVVGMPIPFAFGGAFLWITYTLGFRPCFKNCRVLHHFNKMAIAPM